MFEKKILNHYEKWSIKHYGNRLLSHYYWWLCGHPWRVENFVETFGERTAERRPEPSARKRRLSWQVQRSQVTRCAHVWTPYIRSRSRSSDAVTRTYERDAVVPLIRSRKGPGSPMPEAAVRGYCFSDGGDIYGMRGYTESRYLPVSIIVCGSRGGNSSAPPSQQGTSATQGHQVAEWVFIPPYQFRWRINNVSLISF